MVGGRHAHPPSKAEVIAVTAVVDVQEPPFSLQLPPL
jgi:hypothetical protein